MAEIDRFQHYQVLKHPDGSLWELGRGAMGVTYKAFDTSLRSEVALKVISAPYLNSEMARQRFLREARAAAQLRHPNVATVFHLGETDGTFFYAMEFVDGETVERRVQRDGPLRVDMALRIARQVARALIAADRQHLVHRDIKPANLMVVRDDDDDHLLVKVIDFGLAKSMVPTTDQSMTVTLGGFVGTPHFASPEQLQERPIDIRSDLYSLGASLWYMLSGRPPFQGSLASVIHQHLGQPLPLEVLAKLPPRVAELLKVMLAKRPEERIQTPADVKQRLDDLISELRGLSPTLVIAPHPGAGAGTGSSSAFATGQVIRGRYQLLGHAPNDRTLFKAKDLHANRIVGLRPLSPGIHHDPARLEAVQQEVQRVRAVYHPNVLPVYGLETHEGGVMLVSQWVAGFSLQELLRVRRELSWEESERLLRPVSTLLDFLADRQLSFHALQLRGILVEAAEAEESQTTLLRTSVAEWPAFTIKVDPLSVATLDEVRMVEPTQTLVELPTGEIAPRPVHQLARLGYELLGGVRVPSSPGAGLPRFTPLANLTELGNSVLRQGLNEPEKFPSALDFLSELAGAQSRMPPSVRPASTAVGTAAAAGKEGPHPEKEPASPAPANEEAALDLRSTATGRLLQLVTALITLLLIGALATLVLTNWRERKPAVVGSEPVARQGAVSVNTKPEGATVKVDGQTLGKTPLIAAPLPSGQQVLVLELPGYHSRPVQALIKEGAVNNLGILPLVYEAGQITVKTDPPGVGFELVGPDGKVTVGNAPATIDNLPVGHYVVHLHRPGFGGTVDQEVNVSAGAPAIVGRAFYGANVTLKSDPEGATIYLGDRELGKTPATVILPGDSVELVSRLGALTPVSQIVKPDPNGSTVVEFKHPYGIVLVTSDRPDAEVNIDGAKLGKPPLQGILPPGRHTVTVRAEGAPEQTRVTDVEDAIKVPLAFTFKPVAETAEVQPDARPPRPVKAGVAEPAPALPAAPAATPPVSKTRAEAGMEEERRPVRRAAPVYHNEEDFNRARDRAYDHFDAEWEARKKSLEREKDYYDWQIDHSSGSAQEHWKARKDDAERRRDHLDDEKDAAKRDLKRRWNDD
ncbi:MAG: protein kinase [Verrucomicrobia bacterium]|nr:protein kinase [Verrucomicrobiota bacterium]